MKISVLMPAYNAARFLSEAIQSVLAQTYRHFEFFLIDDGSTDDTPAIARAAAARDARIKIITHPNKGMANSLNDAMHQTQGEWIARIDADDLMEPDRLRRQIAFLRENPDLVVASSLVHYIDEDGQVIGRNVSRFTSRQTIAEYVAHHWPIGFHHPASIFRKDVILSLGGYRPEFTPAEDLDLWNRVVDAGHSVLVQDEYLTRYRIHSSSVTVKRFRVSEAKARWVESCILARHEHRPEPTWEQHVARQNNRPWPRRLNARRRDHARALYKAAVLHFSRGRYEKCLPRLLAAAALEPWYVFQRVLPQFAGGRDKAGLKVINVERREFAAHPVIRPRQLQLSGSREASC